MLAWFRQENMGRGEDGKWISHKSFRVLRVPRALIMKTFHQVSRGVFWVEGVPVTTELFPGGGFRDLTLLKKSHLFLSLRKQGYFFFRIRKIPTELPWNAGGSCLEGPFKMKSTIQKHSTENTVPSVWETPFPPVRCIALRTVHCGRPMRGWEIPFIAGRLGVKQKNHLNRDIFDNSATWRVSLTHDAGHPICSFGVGVTNGRVFTVSIDESSSW